MRLLRLALLLSAAATALFGQGQKGYYQHPTLHANTVVFSTEGDLWAVGTEGGLARRLTTHLAQEGAPRFSPDGKTIAFSGNYEGVNEVYTMPATGGVPRRRTFGGANTAGWTPDGRLMVVTNAFAPMPQDLQLAIVNEDNRIERIPLSQAAQGCYDPAGKTLFFTRTRFQGSWAKRYKGGTAEKLWKFTSGAPEAIPLTADFAGTSKEPMVWRGRVYFLTDRDGTMNLWSMDENGRGLRQHTRHQGWDIQRPQLNEGRIVYQLGADIHLFDIATNVDRKLDISIVSDFENLRERWIKNPSEFMSNVNISPDGSSVSMISRGRVFVAPAKFGRLVEVSEQKPARYRMARVLPGGKEVLVLSTESGEVELWKYPANGIGKGEQLTTGGKILRWDAIPSPDGKYVVHHDKEDQLWLLELATKNNKLIRKTEEGSGMQQAFGGIRWSADSRWIAFEDSAPNSFSQIWVYNVESAELKAVTTDRYNSFSPSWSPDGKYLYFISDRSLQTGVFSPWGPRAPEPFFDKTNKIYELALKKGLRSPFEPPDELHPDQPATPPAKPAADSAKPVEGAKPAESAKPAEAAKPNAAPARVEIDFDGITARLEEVPVPAGNYNNLTTPGRRLCWTAFDRGSTTGPRLECIDIQNKGEKQETVMEGVTGYQLSADGKKFLIRKGNDLHIFDSTVKGPAVNNPKALAESRVNLSDWQFTVNPADEMKEAFVDAWRLHRDYFYDKNMHGVNWRLMRDKYGELVGRVRDRAELNNLIAQMVAELSALHTSVVGGDIRQAPDQVRIAALGAYLEKDPAAGGWAIKHIYRHDPDRPDRRSPLAHPQAGVKEGDVILAINGRDVNTVPHPYELLRNQVNKQVLLRIRPGGTGEPKDVVVKTFAINQEGDLRYHEWEYTRRLETDKASNNSIGYVHLRAMGPNDINTWMEQFYPVFDRPGLIIDVRHNNGGNIDSWLLGRLLRKAWMYWKTREGKPTWNMQYAFRGHVVVLVDEWTASDGEAFAEGFKRLNLGKVIGTRTWGGEIWLSSSNVLVDRGIATAAEMGVYGPERQWLIEGHGVEPDIVVDNLPHSTFNGQDAQLEAAIKHLQDLIKKDPRPVPVFPAYPDKTWKPTSSGASSGAGR